MYHNFKHLFQHVFFNVLGPLGKGSGQWPWPSLTLGGPASQAAWGPVLAVWVLSWPWLSPGLPSGACRALLPCTAGHTSLFCPVDLMLRALWYLMLQPTERPSVYPATERKMSL